MRTSRLEAFSDGVFAIIITIMVLELKAPRDPSWSALAPLAPALFGYVLSFVYLGIYWSNHHHMLHAAERATGGVLWANLHLLFWLSLIPFATAWLGATGFAPAPSALYGAVLLLAAVAYTILQRTIIASQGPGSLLKRAVGADRKGKVSILLYLAAIVCASGSPRLSQALYVAVALIWLVPDRRIESALAARRAAR